MALYDNSLSDNSGAPEPTVNSTAPQKGDTVQVIEETSRQ